MGYTLRNRPDGQVEILLSKPVLIGVFPERAIAVRVLEFLEDQGDPSQPDAANQSEFLPAQLVQPVPSVRTVPPLTTVTAEVQKSALSRPETSQNLPAVAPERPSAPVFYKAHAPGLSETQRDAAFRRIADGEKIGQIAPEFGLTMAQLRGLWANHKRNLQSHMAEGGKIACANCQKPFMPSISHPDTCARCSQ